MTMISGTAAGAVFERDRVCRAAESSSASAVMAIHTVIKKDSKSVLQNEFNNLDN